MLDIISKQAIQVAKGVEQKQPPPQQQEHCRGPNIEENENVEMPVEKLAINQEKDEVTVFSDHANQYNRQVNGKFIEQVMQLCYLGQVNLAWRAHVKNTHKKALISGKAIILFIYFLQQRWPICPCPCFSF